MQSEMLLEKYLRVQTSGFAGSRRDTGSGLGGLLKPQRPPPVAHFFQQGHIP